MINKLMDLKLAYKIPGLIVLSALIIGVSVGVLSFFSAKNLGDDLIAKQKIGVLKAKKAKLNTFLSTIEQDLKLTAENPVTISAFKEFQTAFLEFDNAKEDLQKTYIADNKHPAGEKDKLNAGYSGSTYDTVHGKYHSMFRKRLQAFGYYDIFLFDLEGNVIYSVFKETDYATNVISGKWKSSDLGTIFRASQKSTDNKKVHFTDFKAYGPSANAPASFVSIPLMDRGEKIGVISYQLPTESFNSIISKDVGLGDTGEVLVVGSDYKLRVDSKFTKEFDVFKTEVKNEAITAALSGKQGYVVDGNYRNLDIVYSSSPFEFKGVKWALAAVQSSDEINAPIYSMGLQIFLVVSGLIAALAFAGYFVGRQTTKPISQLVDETTKLAEGDTSVAIDGRTRPDEIGELSRAISVFKDNLIANKKLEEDARRKQAEDQKRSEHLEHVINDFRQVMVDVVDGVVSEADKMKESAGTLGRASATAENETEMVLNSSTDATRNVQDVASVAEELSSAIREIAQQTKRMKV